MFSLSILSSKKHRTHCPLHQQTETGFHSMRENVSIKRLQYGRLPTRTPKASTLAECMYLDRRERNKSNQERRKKSQDELMTSVKWNQKWIFCRRAKKAIEESLWRPTWLFYQVFFQWMNVDLICVSLTSILFPHNRQQRQRKSNLNKEEQKNKK